MAITRLASQCPPIQVSTTLYLRTSAYASTSGIAPSARNYEQYDQTNFRGKLNENALLTDLTAMYGGGSVRCICKGLTLSNASGGSVSVQPGHAMIDGIVELSAVNTGIAVFTGWNYIYLIQSVSGTPPTVLNVPVSTVPPANSVFLGAVNVSAGSGTADFSGVCYANGGGSRLRKTADTGVPSDIPPAGISVKTETLGGVYEWNGSSFNKITAEVPATSTVQGIVRTDINEADPVVITKTTYDVNKANTDANTAEIVAGRQRPAISPFAANTYANLAAHFSGAWTALANLSNRVITAGTGLTGGGDLNANLTIAIANGGVGTTQLADGAVTAAKITPSLSVRTVTSVSSAGDRTLLLTDDYVRLDGTSDAAFVLYGGTTQGNRVQWIRNATASNTWTITVTGGLLIYEGATGVASYMLGPGDSIPLVFCYSTRLSAWVWEVPG